MLDILCDPNLARQLAGMDHYSRIGKWEGSAPGKRVLELGCGPGRYAAMLASLGCNVVGVDPVAYPEWDIIKAHKPVELIANVFAENIPFPNDYFDSVACLGALLYFEDPFKSFSEIQRVLKPGGDLIVRTVNRGNLHYRFWRRDIDPATKNTYTQKTLNSFLNDNGFNVLDSYSYGFYPPFFSMYWWYLVNGILSLPMQKKLSDLLPSIYRVNLVTFARKTKQV